MPKAAIRIARNTGAALAVALLSLAALADAGDLTPVNRIEPEFPREEHPWAADVFFQRSIQPCGVVWKCLEIPFVDPGPGFARLGRCRHQLMQASLRSPPLHCREIRVAWWHVADVNRGCS